MSATPLIKNSRLLSLTRFYWLITFILSIGFLILSTIYGFPILSQFGVGILINIQSPYDVIQISPNSVASDVDIQLGDKILAIDDIPIETLSVYMSGEYNTPVKLTLQREDEPPFSLTLLRTTPRYSLLSALESVGVSYSIGIVFSILVEVIPMAIMILLAIIILRQRNQEVIAIFSSALLLSNAVRLSNFFQVIYFDNAFLGGVFTLYNAVSLVIFLIVFPDGRIVRRWHWVYVLIYLINGIPTAFRTFEPAFQFDQILIFFGVGIQVYRYFYVSNALQKQQTKWIIVSLALGVAGFYFRVSLNDVGINYILGYTFAKLAVSLIPITIAFAILRYRLYDVDLVINRGLVYGLVTISLGLVFLGIFYVIQQILVGVLGQEQAIIGIGLAGASSAFLFNPVRYRIQNLIDRRFYRFRFNLNELKRAQKVQPITNAGMLTGKVLGGYELADLVGRGGMGEVYLGYHDDEVRAIKILPEFNSLSLDLIRRFEREAQIIQALKHPNIIRCHKNGIDDGVYYMALDYVSGRDLKEIITERQKLTFDEIRPFIKQITEALDYAHAQGFIHRDIKPSNIMLGYDEEGRAIQAYLMDFGIARMRDAKTDLTGSSAVGTIDYMAPEQIMSSHEVEKSADIYALGVVLYEILTGEKPFKGTPPQVMFAQLQQTPINPQQIEPSIPLPVAKAILRAMSKKPEDRFASANELWHALVT